ncbi:hypothetical protein DBV15_01469 [Temnothorax longispinosus]|uniref:Uncharacterized protein n=1 Tax=Temnothorax longispinosus TaxID=300112 RepID=A0A4V3SBL3_9HYME|nr:hypothetical protein DBV15_01469 [Temnothorax longispinosus]
MDTHWKDNSMCPTDNDYKTMATRSKCWPGGQTDGNRFPPVKKTCRRYQIQRDSITKHTITIATCVCKGINDKSHCNDPTEGKLSPPTTHAPRRDRGRQTLSILMMPVPSPSKGGELLGQVSSLPNVKNNIPLKVLGIASDQDGLNGYRPRSRTKRFMANNTIALNRALYGTGKQ